MDIPELIVIIKESQTISGLDAVVDP